MAFSNVFSLLGRTASKVESFDKNAYGRFPPPPARFPTDATFPPVGTGHAKVESDRRLDGRKFLHPAGASISTKIFPNAA